MSRIFGFSQNHQAHGNMVIRQEEEKDLDTILDDIFGVSRIFFVNSE